MAKITYFITPNSPWTYLGSARFIAMVEKYNAEVDVRPANFGEVFSQTGGFPLPKRSPERRAYRMMELKRWRAETGVPIVLEPDNFPSDEARAVRLIIAANMQGAHALRLSAEIGKSLWEMDLNLGDQAVLEDAARRAGVDANAVRDAGPDDAALDQMWKDNTAKAVEMGVFGAPSYVFEDGEIMWGQDRVMFVEKKLAAMAGA